MIRQAATRTARILTESRKVGLIELLRKLKGRILRLVWSTREFRIYVISAEEVGSLENPKLMCRDDLSALRAFEASERWLPKEAFLAAAQSRLQEGHHIYTRVEGGRLIHYGWLIERVEQARITEVNQQLVFPAGSASLYDFYTHPAARGHGLYQASLRQMLHDAAAVPGTRRIFIGVLADNKPSRHVIEKLGFHYFCSLLHRTILGWSVRWRTGEFLQLHGAQAADS
jgi:RimJ/RimL family protein N-acetyltransferase